MGRVNVFLEIEKLQILLKKKHTFFSETSFSSRIGFIFFPEKPKKAYNLDYDLEWKVLDRAKPFSNKTGMCALCTLEKF